ncbi:hypothetical protein G6F66_014444 [Rhizopus arrhizus]|nr:hypothetical protein G6F66_014444 [Rhizopus arrhizus]
MPVAAVAGQVVDTVQVDAGEPAIAVAAQAAGGRLQAILRGVAPAAQAGLQHGFGPIGRVTQDDVDHAGDGIGAIDRRGAVAQHFHMVDGSNRNQRQIGPGVPGKTTTIGPAHIGAGIAALAIHQHQRSPDRSGSHRSGSATAAHAAALPAGCPGRWR